jgi:DNA-directed RNA polymerase specialized sigma24 family protein
VVAWGSRGKVRATADEDLNATSFEHFVSTEVKTVRRALVARYGVQAGTEATADAVAWAWQNLDEVLGAQNPSGLVYRVGQSKARRYQRWARQQNRSELAAEQDVVEWDPTLVDVVRALGKLSEEQRVAVLLVHAYGERYDTVAGLLGISPAAVTNHVHRGLLRLRQIMGDER